MKRYLLFNFVFALIISSANFAIAQSKTVADKTTSSPLESLAKKRTQRMKDELFLSQDQTTSVLEINKGMLQKLENLKQANLDKVSYKKQYDQIETYTKNKIVSLLTPAQRQRFENKLFTEIYQTKVNKNNAVSVKK